MKEFIIKNRKAENNKSNNNQILSIIEYANLTRHDLTKTHDDYVELFLFDTKIFLANNIHLRVDD
jgi:hypothetical protein